MTASMIRLIHVGCRELGLDEDTRRSLQLVATGKESLKEMNEAELERVVSALKDRGFRPSGGNGTKRKTHPKATRPDLRFVHVLWSKLGHHGALKQPGRAGLNAFIRSRFEKKWGHVPLDVDAMRDGSEINDVTRALKDWCLREGIKVD